MQIKQVAKLKQRSTACPECRGHGIISTFFGGGRFESSRDCERCHGSGEVSICAECGGIGNVEAGDCPMCDGSGFGRET